MNFERQRPKPSKPEKLRGMVLAMISFMGLTTLAGFGQVANHSGAGIYQTNCVSCHARDGHGSPVGKSLQAPDLHSVQVQQQPDTQLAALITQGKGNMPGFGTRLSNDQITALVKYIRTFRKLK